jgi:uncharacterized protein
VAGTLTSRNAILNVRLRSQPVRGPGGGVIAEYPKVVLHSSAMKYFFLRLIPPRTDFMLTITDAERTIKGEHRAYWQGFAEKGWAVAYGPVADKNDGDGAAFWTPPDDFDPKLVTDNDPTMKADVGFKYEIHPCQP